MKKNAGFTLVELIVVIAILGILAGVAIPVYSGYISKANEAADLTMLDSIKTAVVFAATEKQIPNSATITSIDVTAANGTISDITYVLTEDSGATLTHATFAEIIAYTGSLNKLQSDTFKSGATWASTGTNADKWVKK